MINNDLIQNCLKLLKNKGEVGLYRQFVGKGIISSIDIIHPDIETLNLSDSFFSLYRSTGTKEYFIIAKALRKAAHTIYRQLLRLNKNTINPRFLNVLL